MRKPAVALMAVAALALVAAGCGSNSSSSSSSSTGQAPATQTSTTPKTAEASPAGDIPDNQAYVAYSPGGGFSVKVPEGWAQAKAASGTTFTDKLNSITVAAVPAKAALSVSEAKKADLPKLASLKGFSAQGVSTVHRNAGTAVRIKYLADSKPDPVTGKVTKDAVERYVFFHNGQRVVLTLSGPKGADNVDPWKIVTNSVRWTA